MPYMTNGKRDYKKEKREYEDDNPWRKKHRVKNNAARRQLMKEGKVRVGDGKDVDHKKPLSKGGGNSRSNLRAVSASKNRSFARTKDGKMK
jgi:5-methylcytosine-specific restriction endonuclease McrA